MRFLRLLYYVLIAEQTLLTEYVFEVRIILIYVLVPWSKPCSNMHYGLYILTHGMQWFPISIFGSQVVFVRSTALLLLLIHFWFKLDHLLDQFNSLVFHHFIVLIMVLHDHSIIFFVLLQNSFLA